MKLIKEFSVSRVDRGTETVVKDIVIVEHELTLFVDGQHFTNLLCSPDNQDVLVYGHLFVQGIIERSNDILSLSIAQNRVEVKLKLTPNIHPTAIPKAFQSEPEAMFKVEEIFQALDCFNTQSSLFATTGGVHSAAICHLDRKSIFMEDIGRHNAVDKAFGKALLEGCDISQTFLITSGRVPKELVTKAVNTGLFVIVSRSAPTDKAVELARAHKITLCGFARDRRMNIYSAPERLQLGDNQRNLKLS